MKKYITLERILIVISLIVIVLLVKCNGKHPDQIVKTIPEYIKTTDTIVFNHIKEKKIYLKGKVVYVDSLRHIKYVKEHDTIKKDSMYIDAIAIRKYDTIVEDNDRIKLEVSSTVSGRLMDVSAKYTIKEVKVEPIVRLPRLSFVPGTSISTNKTIQLNAGLQFGNGLIIGAGVDNKLDYSINIAKAFIIFK